MASSGTEKLANLVRELGRGLRTDFGPQTTGNRGFLRGLARANYEYITLRPSIPVVGLVDLLPHDGRSEIFMTYDLSEWNIDANSLVAITALAAAHEPKRIFEFGTYRGTTTRQLAEAIPDAEVFTIDLPPSSGAHFVPGEFFKGTAAAERITQLYGDSQTFDFAKYRTSIDFVFVDASHEYEPVCKDSLTAMEICKPGGMILWDDYTAWRQVRQSINELGANQPIVHIAGTRLAMLQR